MKRPNIDMSRVAAAALESALADVTNAVEEQPKPKRRMSGTRAVVAGAALAVAARVAVKRANGLPSLSNLSAVPDLVRDRLSGLVEHDPLDDLHDEVDDLLGDEDYEDEEPEDEEDEDYDDEDVEEDEEDEDYDDEDVEEPEGEGDEDYDDDEPDEPEDGGDDFDDDEPDEPEGEGDEDFEDEDQNEEDHDEDDDDASAEADSNGRSGRRRAAGSDASDADAAQPTPDLLAALATQRSLPPALARAARAAVEYLDPVARPPEPPRRESKSSAKASKKGKAARR